MQIRTIMAAVAAVVAIADVAVAQDTRPNPVKTCADVRAYIDPDGSMTMETFKKVLIATGRSWGPQQEGGLDNQCKVTAYVKNVIMVQHVTPTILLTTRVVNDGGVCKLTNISIDGC